MRLTTLPGPAVESARERFLRREPLPPGVVRQTILASWNRSRELAVKPGNLELPQEADDARESLLLRVAGPILRDVADQMATEPMSVILCDDDGVVLDRRTGDSALRHHLDRVWLAPGFSYAERYAGTNGIGTALECRGPINVYGHEHYVEHLEELACAGAPIRDPVSGRLVGVLDLTGWRRDANGLMIASATMIARRIEERLLDRSAEHESMLLHEYLLATHHHRGAVMAVSQDLLITNDRARELFDPADQAPIVAVATEALAGGRPAQLLVDLPSGATARVSCRPAGSGRHGGVLLVDLVPGDPGQRRPAMPAPRALPTTVGSGALWSSCVQAVHRHFQAREWLVLSGEPGTGKRTVARATHQLHTPAAHLRVLDARDHGPAWLDDVEEELEADGTLVLAHLDELPAPAMPRLQELLEPHRESTDPHRPWVVATAGTSGVSTPEFAALNDCFPRTVTVPPLRHHIEDVAELVPHLVARASHAADLKISPEVMRVLMRNRWPGNVEQLQRVVRTVVAHCRAGVVDVRDLPGDTFTTVRRVLTPLEAIECDAIVKALLEADGNKARAAGRLGMSRATIYRKIRDYGIALPT